MENATVTERIAMAYRRAMMTREILNRTIITRHKQYSDVSEEMHYESLLEKVQELL